MPAQPGTLQQKIDTSRLRQSDQPFLKATSKVKKDQSVNLREDIKNLKASQNDPGTILGDIAIGFGNTAINLSNSLRLFGMDAVANNVEQWVNNLDISRPTGEWAELPEGFMDILKSPRRMWQLVSHNLPTTAVAALTTIINPVAGAGLIFGMEAGEIAAEIDDYERENNTSIDTGDKVAYIYGLGAVKAGLEAFGIGKITKAFKSTGMFKKIGQTLISGNFEGLTEVAQETINVLAEGGYNKKDLPTADELARRMKATYFTGMATGTIISGTGNLFARQDQDISEFIGESVKTETEATEQKVELNNNDKAYEEALEYEREQKSKSKKKPVVEKNKVSEDEFDEIEKRRQKAESVKQEIKDETFKEDVPKEQIEEVIDEATKDAPNPVEMSPKVDIDVAEAKLFMEDILAERRNPTDVENRLLDEYVERLTPYREISAEAEETITNINLIKAGEHIDFSVKGRVYDPLRPVNNPYKLTRDYSDTYNRVVTKLRETYPGVITEVVDGIVSDPEGSKFKIIRDGVLEEPENGWLETYGVAIRNVAYWTKTAPIETAPHEYAHIYIKLLKRAGNKIVIDALNKIKSRLNTESNKVAEEELVKRIADYYVGKVKQSSTSRQTKNFLRKFWDAIKNLVSQYNARSIEADIIDELAKDFYIGKYANLFDQYNKELSYIIEPSEQPKFARQEPGEKIAMKPRKPNISWFGRMLLSPEFSLSRLSKKLIKNNAKVDDIRIIEEAAKDDAKIIEADMFYKYLFKRDTDFFRQLRHSVTAPFSTKKAKKAKRLEVTNAFIALREGRGDTIKDGKIKQVAQQLSDYFDYIRKNVIKPYLLRLTINKMSADVGDAYSKLLRGIPLKTVLQETKVNPDDLIDAIKQVKEVDNWGIEEYIPKMEAGIYRVLKQFEVNGKKYDRVVAVSTTLRDADKKIVRIRENDPEAVLTIERPDFTESEYSILTDKQKAIIQGMMQKEYKLKKKDISRMLNKEFKLGKIGINPDPLSKREKILMGEEDIFDILDTYAYIIRKKTNLDPVIADVKANLYKYRRYPGVIDLIHDQLQVVKGRYWAEDRALDSLIEALNDGINNSKLGKSLNIRLGGKGMRASRLSGQARKLMGNMLLGYRPVAALVNELDGLSHIWVKTSFSHMVKAQRALLNAKNDKALQDLLVRNRPYFGADFATEAGAGSISTSELWKPLGMFQRPEAHLRPLSFLANYIINKEQGMTDDQAEADARKAIRFQLFTYNLTAIPRWMRSPTGRTVGQFKTYMVKELEFMAGLSKEQIGKYFLRTLALGGVRGMMYTLRTLPILALWLNLDDLTETFERNEWAAKASRGVLGFLNIDATAPMVFQFPTRLEELFGPTASALIKFVNRFILPHSVGKTEFGGTRDIMGYISDVAPAIYYWDQFVESFIDKNGYIRDEDGTPLYQITDVWQRAILASGMSPLESKQIRELINITRRRDRAKLADRRRLATDIMKDMLDYGTITSDLVTKLGFGRDLNQKISKYVALGGTPEHLTQVGVELSVPPEILQLMRTTTMMKSEYIQYWLDIKKKD